MAFDHKTAADLVFGRPLSDERARNFAQQARWTHDDRESLARVITELRRELALREGEIEMLKSALMEHDELRAAIVKYLADNDPEGFGCACEPNHTCGPCSAYKRQQVLRDALDRTQNIGYTNKNTRGIK